MYAVNRFMDLNLLDLDLSDYPDDEHEPLTIDGKLLALSVSETGYIFYLNKAIYNAAGITEMPKTWDDLIDAGQLIGDHNPSKYALGRLDAQQVAIMMFSYLSQITGKNVISSNDTLNFTQQELQVGFNFINVLRNNNVLIPSYKTDTHNDGPTNPNWQLYQNYGGILQWNTAISEYQNTLPNADENLVMAGMFQQNEGEQKGMYKKVSMAYAVSKRIESDSVKQQAVKTFLEFMTTDSEAVAILGVDRGVSNNMVTQNILTGITTTDFTETLEWQGHDIVQSLYNHQLTLSQDLYIHPFYEHDTFRNVYETPIERFLLGDNTATQAINSILAQFDSVLDEVMRG
ncbi:MAG: carbohydrate ABC transporter substrate-binding protein, partial [Acholeplasmataceae bacterium]|nr:carbohydrate ABC transporter substrate-binding protein [Acholeplasmataceae bacterium]